MSVIVWDGKTLAADTQGTIGDKVCTTTKIFRHKNARIGVVGNYGLGLRLVEWFKQGEKEDKFPEQIDDEDNYCAMVVFKDGQTPYVYPGTIFKEPILDAYYAWGSGCDIAIGALYMGADSVTAVKAACRWSASCSEPVECL